MHKSRFQPTGAPYQAPAKRHFGRCRSCKTKWASDAVKTVQPGVNVHSWLGANGWQSSTDNFPSKKTLRIAIAHERCPKCGTIGTFKALEAEYRENVKCDERCTSAKGHKCNCSCGGANHGDDSRPQAQAGA